MAMLLSSLLPLRNDRVVLRPMKSSDAAAYAQGTNDSAVRAYAHLPEAKYTPASVRALIHGSIHDGLRRGDLAVLTIADPSTDAFAGSLVVFDIADDAAEVGFWVHPDSRGKGLSGAALGLAVELARRSGFTCIRARTVPENLASQRILESAGFIQAEQIHDVAPSGKETTLLRYERIVHPIQGVPVTTDRLSLRLHQHADADALGHIYGREDVAQYLLEGPWSASDADRQVSDRIAKTGLDEGSTALALVIENQGQAIGDIQLWLTDAEHRVAEIGWVLDPSFSGQGYATEAVAAVLELAFSQYRLHRVAAQMDARNTASAALAQRVGMQREAHLRQNWWSKGEWTDTLIYGALSTNDKVNHRAGLPV